MSRRKPATEYNRIYTKSRYYRLKAKCIAQLGGKCARCPETEGLEFDHIDPSTKSYLISAVLTHPKKLQAELAKCQLLCGPCHKLKSIEDAGKRVAKGTHGTLSSRRYCRCRECVGAMNRYMLAWKHRRKSEPKKSQSSRG